MIKNNKKNGKWLLWYDNGQIKVEGDYIDGEKSGKWTNWYPWGWRSYELNKKESESAFILWFDDQQKSSEGFFKNNREDNTWVWWSREGMLDSSGVFDKGQRSGKWTFRDSEANKQFLGRYENLLLSILFAVSALIYFDPYTFQYDVIFL